MMDRRRLLQALDAGLRAADGRRCVRQYLDRERPAGPLHVIAIGKAAAAMTRGAADAIGPDIVDGIVVIRDGYDDQGLESETRFTVMRSAHPVPDESSLAAGAAVLDYVAQLHAGSRVLALISGGASSLVEVPRPGVDATGLARANRWLLGSGLDIFSVNSVRRRLSSIKDGGLAAAMPSHEVIALYVSDVRDDDPAWIGSGLLQHRDCGVPGGLPDWLVAMLRDGGTGRERTARVEHRVVANARTALDACAAEARGSGNRVTVHDQWLEGPADAVAPRVVEALCREPPGVHLWGGETTVRLPQRPGRGGRNQHLALGCAIAIAGRDDLQVLCAATDGTDGPGEDAGALVDGGTIERGAAAGLDASRSLAAADSGSFLEASGDLLFIGPTATNVNDIVIGVRAGSG